LNVTEYVKPAVNAFPVPESQLSPVAHGAAGPDPPVVASEVVVWGVESMFH